MRALFFLFVCMLTPSFSFASANEGPMSEQIKDIAFEITRFSYSIEELPAWSREAVISSFLTEILNNHDLIRDQFLINGSSSPKHDLFLFVLLDSSQQKKILKRNPELISKYIDSKIQAKDSSYLKTNILTGHNMKRLDPETVILFCLQAFIIS